MSKSKKWNARSFSRSICVKIAHLKMHMVQCDFRLKTTNRHTCGFCSFQRHLNGRNRVDQKFYNIRNSSSFLSSKRHLLTKQKSANAVTGDGRSAVSQDIT